MREGRNGDFAHRVILNLGEDAVAKLREAGRHDTGEDLDGDEAHDRGEDRERRVVVEAIDQPAVQVGNGGIRDLRQHQADQRDDDTHSQIGTALGPKIRHQRPKRTQRWRAVAFLNRMCRHLMPHIAAAEGEEPCDQGDKRNGSDNDERARHG